MAGRSPFINLPPRCSGLFLIREFVGGTFDTFGLKTTAQTLPLVPDCLIRIESLVPRILNLMAAYGSEFYADQLGSISLKALF